MKSKNVRQSTAQDWETMSRLEQEVYALTEEWKIAHRRFDVQYRRFRRYWNKRQYVQTLRRADQVLKALAPLVTPYSGAVIDRSGIVRRFAGFPPMILFGQAMPKVKVQVKDREISSISDPGYRLMTMIELLTATGTAWIADEVERMFQGGRIPQQMVAECAHALALLFERETGKPNWKRVAHIVNQTFPGILPEDEGGRDMALWIYNLVKRFRARKQAPQKKATKKRKK